MLLGNGLLLAAPAQAADVVTLIDSTATLPATGTASVSFPLTPAANVNLGTAQVSVLSVSHDQIDLTSKHAVTAVIQVPVPAIVLTVDTDMLTGQGEYDVLLAVQAGPARQLLTVTLTRPAAVVAAPATIAVSRTNSWPPDEGSTKPKLRLLVSPDTGLLSLSARQVEAEDPQVTVTTENLKVEPDGSVILPYTVTGAPNPGTVTRTVMLTSPQLSSPISVAFTITTRRSPVLIAFALLAGLALSLILRRILPTLTNWRRLELQRQDLDQQLAAWSDQYQDPDFRTGIQALRQQLAGARTPQLADEIGTAKAGATQQLQKLQNRLADQEAAFDAGTAVFRRQWQLPADRKVNDTDQPGIQAAVDQARACLRQADQELANKNAAAAADALRDLTAAARATCDRAVNWGGQVGQGIGEMVSDLAGYDHGALASLKVALTRTNQGAPAGPVAGPDPVQDAGTVLGEVHLTMERYAAARPYFTALADEADVIARGLTGYGFSADRISSAALALRDKDRAAGGDPGVAGGPLAEAVRELVTAIREDIQAVPGGGADEVSALLRSGDLLGAANSALSQHRAPQPGAAADATRLGFQAQAALTTAEATASVHELRDPALVLPAARAPLAGFLRSRPSATRLAFAGVAAEILHIAAALVIVLVTGYALFLGSWTGTLGDFVKVATWAFAIDLSVTGLTALVAPSAPA
jgi:hypothetical protein